MTRTCYRRDGLVRRSDRSFVRRIIIILALPATVAGCTAADRLPGRSSSALVSAHADAHQAKSWRPGAGRGYPATFVASVFGAGGHVSRGLAIFSSADGHFIRTLTRDAHFPAPAAVSPDGRWVYFFRQSARAHGRCQGNGITEPALWRVPTHGGRLRRAGLRTTSLAFSPDGRMVAYTSARRCGRTIWIVVRDRKAETTRRILLARNAPTSTNPIVTAQLSWAPDDSQLAVAVAPAAAINALYVVHARSAARLPAAEIAPCRGRDDECLDPSFDHRGRLTFLEWRNQAGHHPEQVARWHQGHSSRLFRLSRNQSAARTASIAADGAGTAFLIEGGIRQHQIWRWSRGRIALIRSGSRRQLVTNALWL